MHPQVNAGDVVVDDRAFAYLRQQKGSLDHLTSDRSKWIAAYRASLDQDFRLMRPHLPPPAPDGHAIKILDVGSGLGGIDLMLSRHYSPQAQVILMDGAADLPIMWLHRETFNDMAVAEQFHRANRAAPIGWIDANERPLPVIGYPFDLVLSLGSWCFHYAPEVYLDWVRSSVSSEATLILDVRKAKPQWSAQLMKAFALKAIIHISDKIDRMVLQA